MITFAFLVFIWLLYSAALLKFLFYICDLPPTPIFDENTLGIISGYILALVGWIFFSVFVLSYFLQKVG